MNKTKRIHVVACVVLSDDDVCEQVGMVASKLSSTTDQNGDAFVIGRLRRRFKR